MKRRLYLVTTHDPDLFERWRRLSWPALAFALFTVAVCVLAGWLIASFA